MAEEELDLFQFPSRRVAQPGASPAKVMRKVDYRPVFLALLDVTKLQINRLMTPDSAGQQDGQKRPVTLSLQLLAVWSPPQPL